MNYLEIRILDRFTYPILMDSRIKIMENDMKKALLVIDVQNIYTKDDSEMYVSGSKKIVQNINKLIKYFSAKGLPIIYVKHTHKADGSDAGHMWDFAGVQEDIQYLENTDQIQYDCKLLIAKNKHEIVKHRYSAFQGTNLQQLLIDLNIDRLVITGFMTNFCCESTARQAHDLDYYVEFILDATGCPDLESVTQKKIKQCTADTLATGYAIVTNTKEYLNQ